MSRKRGSEKSKVRVPTTVVDFGPNWVVTGINQNLDGTITFLGADGSPLSMKPASTALTYSRASKKDKVTVQVPDEGIFVGEVNAVIPRYTRVVGVDTNYLTHRDKKLCVTVLSELVNFNSSAGRVEARHSALWGMEFYDPPVDAERAGWWIAVSYFHHAGWLNGGKTILMIVDAHLQSHNEINDRKSPYVANELLPVGVTMAYASSDAKNDSLLNALIAQSDSVAKQVLKNVRKLGDTGPPLQAVPGAPFTSCRRWTFT